MVYLDVETTGLDPDRHEVWEIAYAIEDGPILASVVGHTLAAADDAALTIGRYHERMLTPEDAADLITVYAMVEFEGAFREAVDGATVVAANPAFDTAFIRARWGEAPWKYRLLDVEAYAMPALGLDEPKGLAYICEQLGVQPGNHTAAEDVRALRECHQALQGIYRKAGVSRLVEEWARG